MKAQLYWIDTPSGRRLAILARPRSGDWLADEIRSWRDQGLNVAVSLLTPEEVGEFDLADEAAACAAVGIDFVAVPVPDRGVPASREAFADAVSRLVGAASSRRAVGIHCRAGIGRSAMLAAALLVAAGVSPAEAFERVRAARGVPVPDTPEQRSWIEAFARSYPAKAV
ncbi:MAG TPA: dual specificity protein phosphatase family protein [Gemmataceae bacterium]